MEAALKVLRSSGRPMSPQEIYDQICKEKLFSFGAKDPVAILKAQLCRHSLGFSGKLANSKPTLKQLPDKRYTPL
jgi:hypothetical protein